MSKKKTTEEFLKEAKVIHGDLYDYSRSEYLGATTKLIILCNIHGEFSQRPADHTNGHGCNKCAGALRKPSLTTSAFIAKALTVHGDTFNYEKVEYRDTRSKIIIICSLHGEFLQSPSGHLSGHGCIGCMRIASSKLRSRDKPKFLTLASLVHGNRYNYNSVEYFGSKIKVSIACGIHGEFWQTPAHHLYGHGCPGCAKFKHRLSETNNIPTSLYYLYFPRLRLWKIGCTSREVCKRFKLEKEKFTVVHTKTFSNGYMAYLIEHILLSFSKKFSVANIKPLRSGNTELRRKEIPRFLTIVSLLEKEILVRKSMFEGDEMSLVGSLLPLVHELIKDFDTCVRLDKTESD